MTNLQTGLARRVRPGDAMDAYDRLPPLLRRWVMQAALPWSAASVRRQWDSALRQARGDVTLAIARLDAVERRCLARDAHCAAGAATAPAASPVSPSPPPTA